MKKSLLYLSWVFLTLLFLIILVPMVYAEEGCDSATNSNCIETNSNTNSTNNSNINSTTTVKSPPPSAMAPNINATGNLSCHIAATGAVQTQILGISIGKTIRDVNCERLRNSITLYDMGLKVASIANLCADKRVWQAMWDASTFCPINGKVGEEARIEWENNPHLVPGYVAGKKEKWDEDDKATARGAAGIGGLFLALLFLL